MNQVGSAMLYWMIPFTGSSNKALVSESKTKIRTWLWEPVWIRVVIQVERPVRTELGLREEESKR